MIRHRSVEQNLKRLVFCCLALVAVAQVAACRGLYADAVSILVQMLVTGDFYLIDKARVLSNAFTQLPLMLAVWNGVTDLTVLRYLYSATLLLSPLLFWGLALYVTRRDFMFWPFVLLFVLVYYIAGFVAVSEAPLCFSIVACCLACLLRRGQRGKGERVILLGAALMMPFDYASTLFFGPLLAAAAAKSWYDEPSGHKRAGYWLLIIGLFLASTATGLWEVFDPRDPLNFLSARSPAYILHDVSYWLVSGVALLLGSGLLVRPVWYVRAAAMLCFIPIALLLSQFDVPPPSFSYNIRMYMTLTLLAAAVCLVWFRWDGWRRSMTRQKLTDFNPTLHYVAPVFALFVSLSLLDIGSSFGYAAYLRHFQSVVNARTGLLPLEGSPLAYDPGEMTYAWAWTHPVMSLLLRQDSSRAILLNSLTYSGWVPFDPQQTVPDLTRYYRHDTPALAASHD